MDTALTPKNLNRLPFKAIALWVLAIPILLFIIIPNTDDVSYYLPALSFATNQHLAVPVGSAGYEYVFYNLPALSFIEAGFYKLMLFLHIPLNFYTYRIPIALAMIGLLFSSAKVLQLTASYTTVRQNLFLVLLGISLFSQTWLLNRPETLGLMLLMLHLYLFQHWLDQKNTSLIILSWLSLGMLPALHPQFIPITGLLFLANLYILIKQKSCKNLFFYLLPAGIPLLLTLYYFYSHAPLSYTVLHDQVSGATQKSNHLKTLTIIIQSALGLNATEPFLIKLVNIPYYLPMLLGFGYCCYKIPSNFFKRKKLSILQLQATAIFLGAIYLLFNSWGAAYTIAVINFYVFFTLVVFLGEPLCQKITTCYNKFKIYTLIISSLFITSFALLHITKFSLFRHRFLFPKSAIAKTIAAMKQYNVPLVVMKTQFVPLFTQGITHEYQHTNTQPKIYWLLPSSGQLKELASNRAEGKTYLKALTATSSKALIMTHRPKINGKLLDFPISDSQMRLTAKLDKVIYHIDNDILILADSFKLRQHP